MASWIPQLITAIVGVIIGGLFTYFITTVAQYYKLIKVFRSIAKELINNHEKIYHQKSVEEEIKEHEGHERVYNRQIIEVEMKEHEKNCIAVQDIGKLKTGVVWLVSQAGGNPSDLGLN